MFNKIKEIKSKNGELHFRRWNIISTPWFCIYLHAIYKADEELNLHDHPWNFLSIVLRGWYTERVKGRDMIIRYPGHIAYRKATLFHKIESLHSSVVYTLNFMSNSRREWGYDVDGRWVHNKEYREAKNVKDGQTN